MNVSAHVDCGDFLEKIVCNFEEKQMVIIRRRHDFMYFVLILKLPGTWHHETSS